MDLNFTHIFDVDPNGLSTQELKDEADKIVSFLDAFKERKQGFTMLPKQAALLASVKYLAEGLRGSFEDIVILGIGGSALGITCLRDALKGPYWNMQGEPRLFVLDNVDLTEEIEAVIDPDRTLFIVISKSGRTPETMAQYHYFREKAPSSNFVFITDPDEGELRPIGDEFNIPMLEIPKNVGGRFSVLSPVGLFPAAMLGIDIESLLEGAGDMVKSFESDEFDMNLPFQLAAVQYLLERKQGIIMTVMMPYSSRLWSFADWYRQLLAESLGKDAKGLTPIRALGVTDQHSQLQLYNEGPTDKLISFIEVEERESAHIPEVGNEALGFLSGVSLHELMNTEKRATEQALSEYKKPNLTVKIPKLDAYNLGMLIMLFECSIAFLGEYYRINAFNQPGVELSKKLTKEYLSKSQ